MLGDGKLGVWEAMAGASGMRSMNYGGRERVLAMIKGDWKEEEKEKTA